MENQNATKNSEIVVVMVPLPCQGHLNQLLHLSNLLTSHEITVHFVGTANHNHQAKVRLQGWDVENITKIHFHDFSLPLLTSNLPQPMINSETYFPSHLQPIFEASLCLRQPVFQLLKELSTKFHRVVVIHDSMIASVVQDVKQMSNVEAYTFIPLSVFCVFFSIWNSMDEKPFELDADVPLGLIPTREGCSTLEFKKFANYQSTFNDFQNGMIYNTCRVIEGKYIDMLGKSLPNRNLKHFAIGPFNPVNVKITSCGQERHISLQWLDKHEIDSVIYVSFGSTITMSDRQISELAAGLERSKQKFIWVLRNADKGNIFTGNEDGNPELPKGFEDRVKHRGIVVKDWAPQLEILGHPSVGGFMSHCGWNSCMESMSMGVPIAAWPMHSDQPRNSVLVTKVLGIGTIVREWCGKPELVMSTNIEDAVKTLMTSNEGLEMRKRAVALGESIRRAVAVGGACYSERHAFIDHITRCLEWLDEKDKDSVIYVSFGTTTSMSEQQIGELANGLEKSNQNFIWVLREADKVDIFKENTRHNDVRGVKSGNQVPAGFEERVKGRGLVIRDWAPQLAILGHPSVGGFLSHCGWNSCIESISMGVPIAAWPIHSDQPKNSILVTQVWKAGVAVRDLTRARDAVVKSEVIEKAIRKLMLSKEGQEIRGRARKLGVDVQNSISNGGSSCLEMDAFVAHITR